MIKECKSIRIYFDVRYTGYDEIYVDEVLLKDAKLFSIKMKDFDREITLIRTGGLLEVYYPKYFITHSNATMADEETIKLLFGAVEEHECDLIHIITDDLNQFKILIDGKEIEADAFSYTRTTNDLGLSVGITIYGDSFHPDFTNDQDKRICYNAKKVICDYVEDIDSI